MARRKQTIIQRDMSLGVLREDYLERADTDLRAVSVRDAVNMRPLASGGLEARPGLKYINDRFGDDVRIIGEITDNDGERYLVIIDGNFIRVVGSDGIEVRSILYTGSDLLGLDGDLGDVWMAKIDDRIYIGDENQLGWFSFPDSTVSSIGVLVGFTFAANGNTSTRPFWVFNEGVTLQPSALTGAITVTASEAVFPAEYAGLTESVRLRYAGKQLTLTSRISDTQWNAIASEELPPSFRLTVSDTKEIQVGDAIVGQDTNYQGQVVSINSGAGTIDVVTISFFAGPDTPEQLSSPRSTFSVTAKSSISPLATTFWDEQLISDYQGYPRSGENVNGRLVLSDFPKVPNLVAISSARDPQDFEVGLRDDDAIIRQLGNVQGRVRHVVNAGDLILLTDSGCFVQELRGGAALTPSNFNPVIFDKRGSNDVRPVQVADGVVFIAEDGNTVLAALLDGNVFLKWSVINLSKNHDQLFSSPTSFCPPPLTSSTSEKYLIAVNADGTLAVMFFNESLREPSVGVFPWSTDGTVIDVVSAFGTYVALVDRTINSATKRLLEKFEDGIYVDSAVEPTSAPSTNHLRGKTVTILDDRVVHGEYVVASDGSIADEPADPSSRQIGLNFTPSVSPWAIQQIQSARFGTFDARCIRFLVSVQGTASFQVQANRHTRVLGGYSFGDPLDVPPQLLTRRYVVPVFGRKQNAELSVIRQQPGPFRILYLGQEVQS